jgi:hypothetical protein
VSFSVENGSRIDINPGGVLNVAAPAQLRVLSGSLASIRGLLQLAPGTGCITQSGTGEDTSEIIVADGGVCLV